MVNAQRFLILIIFLIFASLSGCAGYGTAVHTHERNDGYTLHVPASKLQVIIPRNGFVQKDPRQVGGSDSPRYFYFADSAHNIVLSGWFEPDKAFRGMREFWESEIKAYEKNGLPAPTNVTFEKIGNWTAVIYDMNDPGRTITHMRAHWIQAGTWIDIHLSVTASPPNSSARMILIDQIRKVRVEEY